MPQEDRMIPSGSRRSGLLSPTTPPELYGLGMRNESRMKRLLAAATCSGVLMFGGIFPAVAQEAEQKVTRTWAMAEFGEPLYGPDLRHWPYANPDALKGGSVVLGAFGSFDSLNTYI